MSAVSSHQGVSIAVKLVIATSFVVAATVAVTNVYTLQQAKNTARFEQDWRNRSVSFAAIYESYLLATVYAQSVAYAIAGNAYAEASSMLERVHSAEGDPASLPGGRARPKATWFILWLSDTNPTEVARALASEGKRLPAEAEPSQSEGPPMGLVFRSKEAPDDPLEIIDIDSKLKAVPLEQRPNSMTAIERGAQRRILRAPVKLGSIEVSVLWVEISTADLYAELEAVAAQAEAHVQALRWRLWISAGVALLLGIALAMLQAISMARPITELSEQAARIAQGDFERRVPESRRDELGTLARNFNFMARRIGELLAEQAEKAALEHEMELAHSVQQAMLPPPGVVRYGALRIGGYCSPASSCGGDWWMHRRLSGERVLVVIGDATGHGIHSAMIAATARGAVEALTALDDNLASPEQALRAIDSAIRNVGEHHVLMTAFAAILDGATGALHYANAGQNFPYVLRRGADGKLADAAILATAGNPLGDREISVEIRTGTRTMSAGDVFVCFTDGLVERSNATGHMFGDRRLVRVLRGKDADQEHSLDELCKHVTEAVESYAGGEPASDDVTFVACQYDPPAGVQAARRVGTA